MVENLCLDGYRCNLIRQVENKVFMVYLKFIALGGINSLEFIYGY